MSTAATCDPSVAGRSLSPPLGSHGTAPVGRRDNRDELERFFIERRRQRADWRLAATSKGRHQRSLGREGDSGQPVVDRAPPRVVCRRRPPGSPPLRYPVLAPARRRMRAAPSRSATRSPAVAIRRRRERAHRTGPRRACEAACRGCRESAGSERSAAAATAARCAARCSCRSRATVPGQRERLDDRRNPSGSGSQPDLLGPGREDHRVARVFPRQRRRDRQTVGQHDRHVLAAVDGQVDLAAEKGVLELLDEEAFPAGLGERRVLQTVARCLDRHQPARPSRRLCNPGGDGVGLPQRKLAAAGTESELTVAWHGQFNAGSSG